jgi:RimJ/RimL family protein N-acetyltransferase
VTDAILDPPERPTLRDGRILLRPLVPADRDALYQAVAESKEEVGRWMAWCHPDYSPAESAEWIAICERGWAAEQGDRDFGIFEAASGRLLGCIGVNQFNRVHRFANVGYWVRTSSARQGVATAAARLIARYAFEVLGLARIEIVAQVPNVASCKVAEKLGCRLEGVLRSRIAFRTSYFDAAMYSLLPGDLASARGEAA